jgi:hypothetical protein
MVSVWPPLAYAEDGTRSDAAAPVQRTLDEAHRLFFNGQYDDAAALAQSVRSADPESLAASELRTSAIHFQIKRAFGTPDNKERAWDECTSCQELMRTFLAETNAGRNIARAQLKQNSTSI